MSLDLVSELADVKFVTKSGDSCVKREVFRVTTWGKMFIERIRKCEEYAKIGS